MKDGGINKAEKSLFKALAAGDEPAALRALGEGAQPNAVNHEGQSALHCALNLPGDDPLVLLALLGAGGVPTKQGGKASMARLAIELKKPKRLKALLDAGAKVRDLGPATESLLATGARCGCGVEELLAAGAKLGDMCARERAPLCAVARRMERPSDGDAAIEDFRRLISSEGEAFWQSPFGQNALGDAMALLAMEALKDRPSVLGVRSRGVLFELLGMGGDASRPSWTGLSAIEMMARLSDCDISLMGALVASAEPGKRLERAVRGVDGTAYELSAGHSNASKYRGSLDVRRELKEVLPGMVGALKDKLSLELIPEVAPDPEVPAPTKRRAGL